MCACARVRTASKCCSVPSRAFCAFPTFTAPRRLRCCKVRAYQGCRHGDGMMLLISAHIWNIGGIVGIFKSTGTEVRLYIAVDIKRLVLVVAGVN